MIRRMTGIGWKARRAAGYGVAMLLAAGWMAGVFAADARRVKPGGPITFSGRALVLDASGKTIQTASRADAGLLPPEGGARWMALISESLPNLLSAETLYASTVGQEDRCASEASLANLNLTLGGFRIAARFIDARASALVRDGRVYVSGRSEIVGLTVNGRLMPVSQQPNQKIPLPNGQLILNEQKSTISSAKGDLTVWALRAVITNVGTISIGLAHAGLSVGAPRPCEGDFVTGSGWVNGAGQNRLPFSFAFGNRQGTLEGQFNLIDPRGIRLSARELSTYTAVDSNTRLITGNLEYNGVPGMWYRLEVTDGGGSGRSDQITLVLGNTYALRGFLEGGKVTLFRCP